MTPDKIDIVYLWVDGSDKKWQNERDKWYKIVNKTKPVYDWAIGKERFRDNGELLYSLRSVAECANWVNHIYIITGFNQIPKWLNTKNPRITVIPHEQIIPHSALPTFHSTAIEMCIPNIPNLSEKFILMNDDTFFNKPLSPSFFFNRYGHTQVRFTTVKHRLKDIDKWIAESNNYEKNILHSARLIEQIFGKDLYSYRPCHGIDPYLKSSMIECAKHPEIQQQIHNAIHSKFRSDDLIQRWIFNLYDFVMGRAIFIRNRAFKAGRHKIIYFIYNLLHWNIARHSNFYCSDVTPAHKAILKSATFCINDSKNNSAKILNKNKQFLKERFPIKCEFEK